ncbi:MAG: hypothetical protein ACE5HT_00035 [Gemmatimonadales bacterium]
MTSHIFVALGMWDETVRANEASTSVTNRSLAARGLGPRFCGHYNSWLEYGYLETGRIHDARRVLEGCREEAARAALPAGETLDPDNSALTSFVAIWARYVLDTEQWDGDVVRWSVEFGDRRAPLITLAFVRGLAAANRGDSAGAKEWLVKLQTAKTWLENDIGNGADQPGRRLYRQRLDVLELELRAMVESGENNAAPSIALLRRAARIEADMPYSFGPPFIDKPAAALLGEGLLAQHRAKEAAEAFQTALMRAPRRTAALLGLARALSHRDTEPPTEEARRVYSELVAIWHGADSGFAEVNEARRWLAR